MKKQCESCENYFTLGISGGTLISEDANGIPTEYEMCNYCKDKFVEERKRDENRISILF